MCGVKLSITHLTPHTTHHTPHTTHHTLHTTHHTPLTTPHTTHNTPHTAPHTTHHTSWHILRPQFKMSRRGPEINSEGGVHVDLETTGNGQKELAFDTFCVGGTKK
jgi:hypothetical protein